MSEETQDEWATSKWQPMMVYIRNGGRLECECGALAVVVVGTAGANYNELEGVDYWCQSCYIKAVREEAGQE